MKLKLERAIQTGKRKGIKHMAYNPKYNAQNYKYRREKFKVIAVEVERPYYEEILKPAAEKEGKAVGSYIKQAISEKIARDSEARG